MISYNENLGNRLFISVFTFVIYAVTWFCLWGISAYLVSDIHVAGLLLPVGLRLAVLLIMPIKYWWVVLLCEICIALAVIQSMVFNPIDFLLIIAPFVSYSLIRPLQFRWKQLETYWQQLFALLMIVVLNALLQAVAIFLLSKPLSLSTTIIYSCTIASITGGIILAPFFYLLHDYLNQKIWTPLSPALIHKEVTLRPSAFLWMLLFFCLGLIVELNFKKEMASLLLIIVLLPNIFMAYRYGWQGGVLAAVMNSIMLTMAERVMGSFSTHDEMQLFLITQAVIGLGLGIAISRQFLLSEKLKGANTELAYELNVRQNLTRQLVHVEENIRKSIARELHDEIGQNITAIQIQATLANRISKEDKTKQIADAINDLAFQIHSATRQLLTQLRPHILDELGLESALQQLPNEMKFAERGVNFSLNIGFDADQLDDITSVTFYRVAQELLNNAAKHSLATEVNLTLLPGILLSLDYRDNGIGLPANWRTKGTGLKGIEERANALGGHLFVKGIIGTRIIVTLPTKEFNTHQN
tara:strand:+ start:48123 stop:49706 length:1584 start_codon:yes stop_codon:yes gene_type:complete